VILVTLSAWALRKLSLLLNAVSESLYLEIGISGGTSERYYLSFSDKVSSLSNLLL
jgi:hypothetical protein